MSKMSRNSIINSRPTSRAKTTSGHAHSSRIADPLQKVLLFSTPLLGIRGLNMPYRRTGNDDNVALTGMRCSGHFTLERSFSLNAKTHRNVASHVCSADLRKSSYLLPNINTRFGDVGHKLGRHWISSTSKVLSRRSRLECLLLSESVQELESDVDSESAITGRCSHICMRICQWLTLACLYMFV